MPHEGLFRHPPPQLPPTDGPCATYIKAMPASGARQRIYKGFPKNEGNCPSRANLRTQAAADTEIIVNLNDWLIHPHFQTSRPLIHKP